MRYICFKSCFSMSKHIFRWNIHAILNLILDWPPDAKSQLIGKDSDAGKYWRQEKKGITEDKIVGWHHWLNGPWAWAKFQEMVKDREAWSTVVRGAAKNQKRLSDWTTQTALGIRFWIEAVFRLTWSKASLFKFFCLFSQFSIAIHSTRTVRPLSKCRWGSLQPSLWS